MVNEDPFRQKVYMYVTSGQRIEIAHGEESREQRKGRGGAEKRLRIHHT
jgi:hypothetical protein